MKHTQRPKTNEILPSKRSVRLEKIADLAAAILIPVVVIAVLVYW